MNKLIIFPLFLMILIAMADAVIDPTAAIMNDSWLYGLMGVAIVALGVVGLFGKETLLAATWKDLTLVAAWLTLTGVTLSYFTSPGFLGNIFYIGITIMFFIGIFMDLDGGGD